MESNQRKYRHEFKYVIDRFQTETLLSRLDTVMSRDAFRAGRGEYTVRSLYLDDLYLSCMLENEAGVSPREKYRFRLYNADSGDIKFEIKTKDGGKTLKESCPVPAASVSRIISGEGLAFRDDLHPLLKKEYLLQETRGLKPSVIVEYDRIPFICPEGNVRITLDLNIRSSSSFEDFFRPDLPCTPLLDSPRCLLEVKYDEFIPDAVRRTVHLNDLKQCTFSKYYLCKRNERNW